MATVKPYLCPGCKKRVVFRPCQVCRARKGDGRGRRFSDRPVDEKKQRACDTAEARRLGVPTPDELDARAAAVRQAWRDGQEFTTEEAEEAEEENDGVCWPLMVADKGRGRDVPRVI